MNAVTVIRARGAIPRIGAAGNLALDLSAVPQSLRAEVVVLARRHKNEIIDILGAAPAVPKQVHEALMFGGFELTEWTPEACRLLLDRLSCDWPDFRVNGWHGCDYPQSWPADMCLAVQSVYVQSIQDQRGVQ